MPPTTEADFQLDPSLPPQGYELRVANATVAIRYADDAGRRYAEQSLRQLRGDGVSPVAPVEIRDWPDFAVRGFMLDVSRNRVPTRQSLERTVEVLALCRINHFQLYIENTFAYRDHEVVWRNASPLTGDDLRWLDQLCGQHGIELSVNQNCFGHMERWLKHPEYRERAEAPDGWRSKLGGLIPAAVLAPTQDNADFALALVRELMSHLTTRRVNIGCDETFELGQGVSKAAVEAQGRGRVYFDHLRRLIEPLRSEGFEMTMFRVCCECRDGAV